MLGGICSETWSNLAFAFEESSFRQQKGTQVITVRTQSNE